MLWRFNLGKLTRAQSQFINVAAGEDLAPVCDDLTNEDDTIRHFILRNPEDPKASLILVDTPGLDNYDFRANDLILQNTRDWINNQYSSDTKLGGILYLHDITDDRGGLPYQNGTSPVMRFTNPELLKHLMLASGKWDRQRPEENFERREKELVATVWKRLLDNGAKSHRFLNTQESAWMILDELLQTQPLQVDVLQRELKRIQDLQTPSKKKNGFRGFFANLLK
ncbi:hypothetical protein EST38_g14176 [Candolleomyces aberdarensis]|uniref:G domain-containing protein n=1 Tax=Candolleomyces aberdarensis TaxID=2316362 RepID=A0A4Q2CYY1_9AGAR|nr:hypothetical protein EST38_g14176 [Candolleomyces aberdarensis]